MSEGSEKPLPEKSDKKERKPKKKPSIALCLPTERMPSTFGFASEGGIRSDGVVIGADGVKRSDPPTSITTPGEVEEVSPGSEESGEKSEVKKVKLKYEDLIICECLGRGNSASVYRAVHRTSGQVFAIKKMDVDASEEKSKTVLTEFKSLYKCNSPYVIRMFDAFYRDSAVSVVLEYCDCGALSDLFLGVPVFPEEALGKIAEQSLQGLHYLHKSRHIVHRDIKPQNILITSNGEIKISDFGMSGQLENTLARANSFLGTMLYMSPERISCDSHSYDSDIFSLGVTLAHCALGRYPKEIPEKEKGYFPILTEITSNPTIHLPDTFSPEFRDFVAICTQKDPADRLSARRLLLHPFIEMHKASPFSLTEWVREAVRKTGEEKSKKKAERL